MSPVTLDSPTLHPLEEYPLVAPDVERAARADLLRQIARLEAQLGAAVLERPELASVARLTGPARGPRILSLAELERVRDGLVGRLDAVRHEAIAAEERHAAARATLEAMYANPSAHRWMRVTNAHLGLPGCRSHHVRPRLGPVGMLLGWWRVKVSSGCPLAGRREGAPHPFSSGAIVSPAPLSCSQ